MLRRQFKVKRKSDPEIDENEDGARASLIEEGVSTFIFSRGLERDLFENIESVDYDLLKSIQELIKGYEVERCSLREKRTSRSGLGPVYSRATNAC